VQIWVTRGCVVSNVGAFQYVVAFVTGVAIVQKPGKCKLAFRLTAHIWWFLTLRAREIKGLINSNWYLAWEDSWNCQFGTCCFLSHQSLGFERGWLRKFPAICSVHEVVLELLQFTGHHLKSTQTWSWFASEVPCLTVAEEITCKLFCCLWIWNRE